MPHTVIYLQGTLLSGLLNYRYHTRGIRSTVLGTTLGHPVREDCAMDTTAGADCSYVYEVHRDTGTVIDVYRYPAVCPAESV